MKKECDRYDYLCYQLFETLIPAMLYHGTEKEKDEFFKILMQDGKTFIHDMYQTICEEDGLPYPYKNIDFEVKIFERGGVNILQILLPPHNFNINNILRAYFLFTRCEDSIDSKRYFIIRQFNNGNIFIIYINHQFENLLGEELTKHTGDMEYEYWKLVSDYAKIIILDMYEN